MSARAILQEMLALLKAQTEAVVAGDHEAVQAGADRHEQLLAALQGAPPDAEPEQLRMLCEQIDFEKTKLQSLLTAQSQRVDLLLRAILGGHPAKTPGYPAADPRPKAGARMLNRRA